jgi:hypothetical protein
MSEVDGGAVAPAEGVSAPATPVASPDPGVQTPKPVSAEPIAAPEPKAEPEPKKPEPTPRDAIRRAADKVAADQKAQAEKPVPKVEPAKAEAQAPAKADGPSRDTTGKFAGKEPSAPDAGAASKPADSPADSPQSKLAPDTAAKPSFTAGEPPARFSAAAKAEWAAAPESVRAEAERAIKELTAGHEKYRGDAEEFGKLREFHEVAKANGRDLHAALTDMKRLEDAFQRAPFEGYEAIAARLGHGSFQQVAEAFLGRAPDQAANATAAAAAQLRQRADHFERLATQQAHELASLRQEKETVTADTMTRQIEDFKSQPGRERFDELRPAISRLLTAGLAEDLDEAYQMASTLKPGPQNSARTAPAQTPEPPPAAPAIDLTAQTQKGSKSIAGAPSPGSNPAARQASSSIRDAIRRAAAQAG